MLLNAPSCIFIGSLTSEEGFFMTFSEYLNECMLAVHCNARKLSEVSGLSQALISRYRNGDRLPAQDSQQLTGLIRALVQLSREQKHTRPEEAPDDSAPAYAPPDLFTEEELLAKFTECLHNEPGAARLNAEVFNALLVSMNVNIKKLAQAINYDPSYISRIRNGQRKPSDSEAFTRGVVRYLLDNCDAGKLGEAAGRLSGDPSLSDISAEKLEEPLMRLLLRGRFESFEDALSEGPDGAATCSFIRKLSEFDLDEYIQAIHFDTLHIPTAPIQFPASKVYYGIGEMKQGELDFFRQTVLSRSGEPVYMCNDMDIADMAEDLDFCKKWMFSVAAAVKKGLRINIIHSLNRPFHEMMLGLESWLPLYMTGQVTSYYLTGPDDPVYTHMHYVSGAAALTGECIRGHHDNGRYYLTNNKKEIAYYRSYCSQLFDRAKPLMAIFTEQTRERYAGFLSYSASVPGPRRSILSAPPLASMPADLLDRILSRCAVPEKEAARIRSCAASEKRILLHTTDHSRCETELSIVSREEFEAHPVALALSGAFPERHLCYTWEEYQEHLAANRLFLEEKPLWVLHETGQPGFRNIQIHILKGKWVMVSKIGSPAIHFVIRHPRLRSALENMVLPVVETDTKAP